MPKRSLAILCVLFAASLFITGFGKPPASAPEDLYLVTRVIDGDTIELANGDGVRYVGIDTPETKHPKKPVQYFGKEAYEANKKLVEGKKVKFEFDVQKKDKYDRILAYVFVDDIFVNAWLVENGYAHASSYPPNVKYQNLFLNLQKEARENNKGLWEK